MYSALVALHKKIIGVSIVCILNGIQSNVNVTKCCTLLLFYYFGYIMLLNWLLHTLFKLVNATTPVYYKCFVTALMSVNTQSRHHFLFKTLPLTPINRQLILAFSTTHFTTIILHTYSIQCAIWPNRIDIQTADTQAKLGLNQAKCRTEIEISWD